MGEIRSVEFDQGSVRYRVETGRYAGQADGAVTVTVGETQVLVTAVASATARKDIDFFPLLVDFEERMYAAGRIPGSFFRREGRPSEEAILAARLVDRSLRPNFPEDLRNDVHIVATILSVDLCNPSDVAAINGASAALMLSGIPFDGPVGAVRMALVGGEWIAGATYQEIDHATFELVVAGKRVGSDIQVVMVEASAPQDAFVHIERGDPGADEKRVVEGLQAAKPHIEASITAQEALVSETGRRTKAVELVPLYSPEVFEAVERRYLEEVRRIIQIADKSERNEAENQLVSRAQEELVEEFPERQGEVARAIAALTKREVRRRILDEGIRIDGRKPDEIRPIKCDVGVVPRAHGSGLFERGETQVLNIATLGMLHLVQQLDTLSPEETKRYMHHYYFPPYSTGEAQPIRGPRRREIGHGALAERALLPVIPPQDELPYALRLVSEVLSSNGSTSMASVCASTLSLLDAGIHIKAPVGGVAMGLVMDGDRHVTLTDILGAEDAFGDMDFKVAGTRDVVTALQLDTKVGAIPVEILSGALEQARNARLHILDKMAERMPGPREELSEHAPRVITLQIPTDKIGDVIGPKGKVITEIQNATGTEVTVESNGTVYVGSTNLRAAEEAVKIIESIVHPPAPELGKRYRGVVVSTTKFGAFVNFLPGRDGLVHISKLGRGKRIARVEDVVTVGDELEVVVAEIDEQGRVSLDPVFEDEAGTGTDREEKKTSVPEPIPPGPGARSGTRPERSPASEGESVASDTGVVQPQRGSEREARAAQLVEGQPTASGDNGEIGRSQSTVAEGEEGGLEAGPPSAVLAVGGSEREGVSASEGSAANITQSSDEFAGAGIEGEGVLAPASHLGEAALLPTSRGETEPVVQAETVSESLDRRTERPRRLRRIFADFEEYFDRIAEETWGDLGPGPRGGERSAKQREGRKPVTKGDTPRARGATSKNTARRRVGGDGRRRHPRPPRT